MMNKRQKLDPIRSTVSKAEGESQQIQAWEAFPVENENTLQSMAAGKRKEGTANNSNQIESWNQFAKGTGQAINNQSRGE